MSWVDPLVGKPHRNSLARSAGIFISIRQDLYRSTVLRREVELLRLYGLQRNLTRGWSTVSQIGKLVCGLLGGVVHLPAIVVLHVEDRNSLAAIVPISLYINVLLRIRHWEVFRDLIHSLE